MNLKRSISAVLIALTVGSTITITGPNMTVQAKALSYDKSLVWPSRTITYHINSTGSYYRSIWSKAVKTWNAVKVVKLVKVKSSSKAQIRLSTKADVEHGKYSGMMYTTQKVNSEAIKSEAVSLSRRYMKENYLSKHERTLFATQYVGTALGLNGSKTFGDVMGSWLRYNVGGLSKSDKQGLKNAYKNVK